jgi:hypothetical protein
VKRVIRTLGIAAAITVLTAGVAAAATLGLVSAKLSAGHVAVGRCATSALTATRNVDNSGDVTQVNVLSVPQACAGETLVVTLENSAHASLAAASTTVGTCTGGCTVSLAVSGTVAAANLTGYAFSLTH